MLKKFLKLLLNQRGQMLVLYALLTPLLFFVGGAAVDLGWYYVNAARLQNMADSAIIASATVLTKPDNEFSNYRYNYFLPQVPKNLTADDPKRNSKSGDTEAKTYISKNLESSLSAWQGGDEIDDTFSDVKLAFNKETFKTTDSDGYPVLYYEITLTETPNHFFEIFNSFGDMTISAKSAAKFTQVPDPPPNIEEHGPNFRDQMEDIKDDKVYAYWEVMQHEYKVEFDKLNADIKAGIRTKEEVIEMLKAGYISRGASEETATKRAKDDLNNPSSRSGNRARERSVNSSGNYWLKDLTNYRVESLSLDGQGNYSFDEDQRQFDDIFINYLQDLNFKFKEDWDISLYPDDVPSGFKAPGDSNFKVVDKKDAKGWYCAIFDNNGNILNRSVDTKYIRFGYRIYGLISVEEDRLTNNGIFPYLVREDRELPDPLYAKIEDEPIWAEKNSYFNQSQTEWSSVHQIIINVNNSNYRSENDTENRPIIFFYDGPRKIKPNNVDANGVHIRDSKPILLNLNEDFRGAIYAPNSPVIVMGNNHNFSGFIIAKTFLKLKTASEFETDGFKKVIRKDNNNEVFVAIENIKTWESESESVPADYTEVTYSEGVAGKTYYIERNGEHFEKISSMRAKLDTHPIQQIAPIFVNERGEVVTSGEISANDDATYNASDFNLGSSKFDNFLIVKFVNRKDLNVKGSLDTFFTTERAIETD